MSSAEDKYIRKRILKGKLQSIPFYLCRLFPIKRNKIVFCCIEGTTGYSCNPKYIAEEFIKYNKDPNKYLEAGLDKSAGKEAEHNPNSGIEKYELVWLVNDTSKKFPSEIKVVKNTLWNRAYQLTTARFWIDNSRKQLECRKRKGQTYIQTWHAKLGFKPTCLDRGASFSKIAYLVSKHDSDMVDYWLSNSDWYDKTLKTGSLYEGKVLRTGSPRCDILVKAKNDKEFKDSVKKRICELYNIDFGTESDGPDTLNSLDDIHFMMYAPTFRGGSQGTDRTLAKEDHAPDYAMIRETLEKKFGGRWYILLRLHPQMVVRNLDGDHKKTNFLIDVSRVDDMYEILSGCEAFMTDYSSAAFDAVVMEMPVVLYCDDYAAYENERGSLLWNLRELPFPFAENDDELKDQIAKFDREEYGQQLRAMFQSTGMKEDGNASENVVDQLGV